MNLKKTTVNQILTLTYLRHSDIARFMLHLFLTPGNKYRLVKGKPVADYYVALSRKKAFDLRIKRIETNLGKVDEFFQESDFYFPEKEKLEIEKTKIIFIRKNEKKLFNNFSFEIQNYDWSVYKNTKTFLEECLELNENNDWHKLARKMLAQMHFALFASVNMTETKKAWEPLISRLVKEYHEP